MPLPQWLGAHAHITSARAGVGCVLRDPQAISGTRLGGSPLGSEAAKLHSSNPPNAQQGYHCYFQSQEQDVIQVCSIIRTKMRILMTIAEGLINLATFIAGLESPLAN